MVQAMLNAVIPSVQRAPQRGSTVVDRALGQHAWDEEVVADIASLSYVRVVVFTDGLGLVVHQQGRSDLARDTSEHLDMLLASMEQTGGALAMGDFQVGVGIFTSGTVISASSRGLRVTVLADGSANLGQLLSQVRRVFVSGHV
jgi:hypothetical protein